MSKKKITPRGELVKLARELKPNISQAELMRLCDEAMETGNPEQLIRERLAPSPEVGSQMSEVGGQKSEIREGEAPAEPSTAVPYAEFASEDVQRVLDASAASPTVDWDAKNCDPIADVKEAMQKFVDTPLRAFSRLSLPVIFPNLAGMPCSGNKTRHVDLQLTRHPLAREVLTRLRHKLHADHVKTINGRHVDQPSQALVWVLEQIGRVMGIDRELAGTAPGTAAVDIGMNATPLDAALEQAATAVGAAE